MSSLKEELKKRNIRLEPDVSVEDKEAMRAVIDRIESHPATKRDRVDLDVIAQTLADYPERNGVPLAEALQLPPTTGDKTHERSTTPTTSQSQLEVHMDQDVALTTRKNMVNAFNALPAEEKAKILHEVGAAPRAEFSHTQYLASIDQSLVRMTRKDWKDHSIEVGKTAAGAAIGVGVAVGVYALGKYLLAPTE